MVKKIDNRVLFFLIKTMSFDVCCNQKVDHYRDVIKDSELKCSGSFIVYKV